MTPILRIEKECHTGYLCEYEQLYINMYLPTGLLFNIAMRSMLHNEIDHKELLSICKKKKIRYNTLAEKIGVSYCSIAGYLTGQRCQLNLEKARRLRDIIQSM